MFSDVLLLLCDLSLERSSMRPTRRPVHPRPAPALYLVFRFFVD